MNGLKAFGIGLGATAGVIIGVYAGVKGIEMVGYLTGRKDAYSDKRLQADIDKRVAAAIAAHKTI
jgi:hypothetical protein